MTDLTGVDEKIRRARKHLADFKTAIDKAMPPDSYHFTFDPNVESGEYVYRAYGVPPPDPDWSLIVGDCVNNLRAALDHLAWQLVRLGRSNPTDKTYFPIREAPFNDEGKMTFTQLQPNIRERGIPNRDILKHLEDVQPYRGENGDFVDPHKSYLWALRVLSNIDKHRLLLTVTCVFDSKNMWWSWPGTDPIVKRLRVNHAPLKDGDPIAWFTFIKSHPPQDFDPHPMLQVAIREREIPYFARNSAWNVLQVIRWTVEDDIMGRFRPLFS